MAKGLSSYPEEDRKKVAERRTKGNTKGLSYWGAIDYLNKKQTIKQD